MKEKNSYIVELPEKTMFSRIEAARVLGVGVSTLDSLIPYSELPRVIIRKRVFITRKDLESYIDKSRCCYLKGGK